LHWAGLNFLLDGKRRARFTVWMTRDALLALSKEDLVALILAQAEQLSAQAARITALQAQIAVLEAKLAQPPKTPDNSSLPPSKGEKPNRGERRAKRWQSHPYVDGPPCQLSIAAPPALGSNVGLCIAAQRTSKRPTHGHRQIGSHPSVSAYHSIGGCSFV
jgi:hypothetical protein